jgi:hypothetical protein
MPTQAAVRIVFRLKVDFSSFAILTRATPPRYIRLDGFPSIEPNASQGVVGSHFFTL